MSSYYSGKVVLVTGGSSGIGRELCRQLLSQGASVIATGRTVSKLRDLQNEFQSGAVPLLCLTVDMREADQVDNMMQHILDRFGRLDIIIANAGSSGYAKLEHARPQMLKEVIDTNIYGTLFPVVAGLQQLRINKGRIMLVSSMAGLHGLPDYSSYSLSKMALRSLQQSLRTELKGHGVKVCLCLVGFTENEEIKTMLDASGNAVAVPKRPRLLLSSRRHTASRILFQLRLGIPVMSTSYWGFLYRALAGTAPGLLNRIIRLFYKNA